MAEMSNLEVTAKLYSVLDPKLAKVMLKSYKEDRDVRERAVERNIKLAKTYRQMAARQNLKVADRLLTYYINHMDPDVLKARAEQESKKYEKLIAKSQKQRDKLVKKREELKDVTGDEQSWLAAADSMLKSNPDRWLATAYGRNSTTGAAKGPGKFTDDNSPAVYRGLALAVGVDDSFFADALAEADVDAEKLYRSFHEKPEAFDAMLDDLVAKVSADKGEQLKKSARSAGRPAWVDGVVQTELPRALRSYVKTERLADITDRDIAEMNEKLTALTDGGKLADFAFAQAEADAWDDTVKLAARLYGTSPEDADRQLRALLTGQGLGDPDTAAKAVALVGDDPGALSSVLNTQDPEKQRLMLDQYINRALQNQVDPQATAIANYFKKLETLPQDPSFALWRRQNGVDSTGPVSLAEAQRYRRQAARAGSPLYRHKRTGDLRLVRAVDTDYAVDTSVGTLFFAEDGEYLRPEQIEQMAAEDLKEARYVEFDLSNDDLRTRVFAAVADPEMRKALAVVEKQEGFTDRARLVYDKDEGRFVVLDGDKRVRFQGNIDQDRQGSILLAAEDPQLADPVGSAADYQANKPKNYLKNEEFEAMFTAPAGDQVDAAAAYLPARMAEPPVMTFHGEMVYTPGQDPGELQFLFVGPDGRKQLRKIQVYDRVTGRQQLFEARPLEMGDLEAYNRDTKSDLNERQFQRMLRGPLLGRGRKGRDERQARRARVRSGDTISTAREIEPREFSGVPEATKPVDGTPAPEETASDKPSQVGGGKYARALGGGGGRSGQGGGRSATPGLPATEAAAGALYAQKIQAADAIARGAAPGTMTGDPVSVGETPPVVSPYRPGGQPDFLPAPVSTEHSAEPAKKPSRTPQTATPLAYFGREAVASVPSVVLKSGGKPLLQTPSGRSVLAAGDEAASAMWDKTGLQRAYKFFSGLDVDVVDEGVEVDDEKEKQKKRAAAKQ